MTDRDIKEFASRTIRKELASRHLKVSRIILFGSQARGTADSGSDWDFLVSITDDLSIPEKAKIVTAIQRRLATRQIAADIILKSESSLKSEAAHVGLIAHYALKEGVALDG